MPLEYRCGAANVARINFSNVIYRHADKYHVSAQLSSRNIAKPDYNYESHPSDLYIVESSARFTLHNDVS